MAGINREITDTAKIAEIMQKCGIFRLGFVDGGEVYIVPLHFGYEHTENGWVLYSQGAKEGRKVELIKEGPRVGFEMDTELSENGARFFSIVGTGSASLVEDREEKKRAISLIIRHNTGKDADAPDSLVDSAAVTKITVDTLSCISR